MSILMHHNMGKGQIVEKGETGVGQRLLIVVSVLGSTGMLRFVVSEDLAVSAVIQTALRLYARQGRLPVLGSDMDGFLLYCANSGADALSPRETIGSGGTRNFLLCPKQVVMGEPPVTQPVVGQKLGRKNKWTTKKKYLPRLLFR